MIKINPKIYILDDDEAVGKAFSRLLRYAGYETEVFTSARGFLASVPPETEGVLILDIRMPEMDGFQVQGRLNGLHSNLQIIFVTAHVQAGDRERAMEAGAKGFLQKPFDEELLLDLISSLSA